MSRNVLIAIVVAVVVVFAFFLFVQPRGQDMGEGLPPHATTE